MKWNPDTMLALDLASCLLVNWYGKHEEDTRVAIDDLARENIGGDRLISGMLAYLQLTYDDQPESEALRNFVEESKGTILHIFRLIVSELGVSSFGSIKGRISERIVVQAISCSLLAEVMSEQDAATARAQVQEVFNRLPFSVIPESVETQVRGMLESGMVSARHPAHAFLTRLVEVAPATRLLPVRSFEMLKRLAAG